MYCPNCKKEVDTVAKPVGSKYQYNCKECGVAIALLPDAPREQAKKPVDIPVEPVATGITTNTADGIEYACDFGKYAGEPFSAIPTDYLKKQCLKKYKSNPDVIAAIQREIESRNE